MEHWNFHNYIALPLEQYGKTYIGSLSRTADEIEAGEFIDVMLSILSIKFGGLKDIEDFVALCKNYVDVPASTIPKEKVIEIFEEFKMLVKSEIER